MLKASSISTKLPPVCFPVLSTALELNLIFMNALGKCVVMDSCFRTLFYTAKTSEQVYDSFKTDNSQSM